MIGHDHRRAAMGNAAIYRAIAAPGFIISNILLIRLATPGLTSSASQTTTSEDRSNGAATSIARTYAENITEVYQFEAGGFRGIGLTDSMRYAALKVST